MRRSFCKDGAVFANSYGSEFIVRRCIVESQCSLAKTYSRYKEASGWCETVYTAGHKYLFASINANASTGKRGAGGGLGEDVQYGRGRYGTGIDRNSTRTLSPSVR